MHAEETNPYQSQSGEDEVENGQESDVLLILATRLLSGDLGRLGGRSSYGPVSGRTNYHKNQAQHTNHHKREDKYNAEDQ